MIEAMKQALDWFKCYRDKSMSRNNAEALAEEVENTIRQAIEQAQKQEPVAWGVHWGKAGEVPCVSIIKRLPEGGIEVLAVEYGSQREWVALTDEEIEAADYITMAREDYEVYSINQDSVMDFARAIEAKLKEKNT